MPFVLYVAADLYSQKVNLELEFAGVPTVNELVNAAQTTFNNEALALKPPTMALQTLRIQKLQVYRDDDGSWADLTTPTQLAEFAQLYVFQIEPQYQESQQPIPPARKPSRAVPMSPGAANVSGSSPIPATTTPRRFDSPQRGAGASAAYSTALNGSSASVGRTPVAAGSAYRDPVEYRQVSPRRSTPGGAAGASYTAGASANASYASAAGASREYNGPASPVRANLARAPVPEHPSQRDKIAYLFDEMDTNGNRVIEPEEFRALIRALGVDFSNAVLSDLFHKGDLDRDGVLSLGEFTQLFTAYPTLLDAVFFRLRDVQEARNLQAMLAEERAALDAAREQRSRAATMTSECSRLVADAQVKTRDTEQEHSRRATREAELQHVNAQASAELDQAGRLRMGAAGDVDAARDKEASHKVALTTAATGVRDAESRLASEHEQLRLCQDKERQLQQMLLEAQRATERQHQAAAEAQAEVAHRRDQEHVAAQHLQEVQRELAVLNDRLAIADRELRAREERQKDVAAALADAAAEVQRVVRRLEDERGDLAAAADREKSNRALLAEAEAAVLAAERRVAARDQDILVFNQRRAAMEQQERPLLEQEVRLREQRDSLDERENRFRRDAVTYFDSSRIAASAASPGRGAKTISPPRTR